MKQKLTYLFSLLLTALFLLPWSGVKAETTQLNEGFEGDLFEPDGWSTIHVSGGQYWEQKNDYKHAGTYSAFIKWNSSGHENYLITPQLQPKSGESLTFYVSAHDYSGTTLTVEVSTTSNGNAANFSTELARYTTGSSSTYYIGSNGSSSFVQKTIDLSSYVGQKIFIAFHVKDNNGGSVWIDDVAGVSIVEVTCPKPTLNINSKTDASASFSWTKGKDENQWQYCYKSGTAEPAAGDWSSPTSATSTTLSGLTASTEYTFYLRAYCSDVDQSDPVSKSFKTKCAGTDLPFDWTFESNSNYQTLPGDCWARFGTTYYPDVESGSDGNHTTSGSKGYRFYGYSSDGEQILILPNFEQELKDLKVSFYYKSPSSSYATLSVGYITDPTDKSTYQSKSSLDYGKSSWTKKEIQISDAPEGSYFAIYYIGKSTYSRYSFYIDDIHVESTIDCSKPATPTYDPASLTENSVTVSWTANTNVADYKYINVDRTANPDYELNWTNDATAVTGTSVDLTTLTSGHNYEFYVMCACGTVASDACAFTPSSCPAIESESITLSDKLYNSVTVNWSSSVNCDVRYSTDGGENWSAPIEDISDAYKAIEVSVGNTYTFAVKPHCNNAEEAWVVCAETYEPQYPVPGVPAISDITDNAASAEWTIATGASGYQYIAVASGEPNWTDATSTTSLSGNAISGLGAGTDYTLYVRAKFGENNYGAANSNTFSTITLAPAFTSAAPSTSETTATLALESYTGSATQFQYVVMPGSKAANWTGATIVAKTTSIALSTGLSAGNSYTLYVRAYYGESVQSSAVSKAFTTDCPDSYEVSETVAWTQDFEAQLVDAVPACWESPTTNDSWEYAKVVSTYGKNSTQCLDVKVNGTATKIIELPVFNEKAKYLKISFDYNNGSTSSNYGPLEVGYYSSGTFTNVATLDRVDSYSASGVIEMPSNAPVNARVAFRVVGVKSGSNSHSYIDNISVLKKPSCPVPTDLAAEVTFDGADVTWTAGGEETEWSLRYSVKDANSWTTVNDIDATNYTITGLSTANIYEVQVQANCGSAQSSWTASAQFQPECLAPSDLHTTALAHNAATIAWTRNAKELRYKTGSNEWTVETITPAATSFNLSDLNEQTTYTVQVKAACEDGDNWSDEFDFTTKCEPTTIVKGTPFEEGFSSWPSCWEKSAGSYPSASGTLRFYGKTGDSYQEVVFPGFTNDIEDLTLSFEHKNTYSGTTYGGTLQIGYIKTDGTFVNRATLTPGASYATYENVITKADAEDAVANYAIRYTASYDYASVYIDNVKVFVSPTCYTPANLSDAASITSEGATFTWTASGHGETQYQYCIDEDWSNAIITSALTATVTGLNPSTNYTFYVRSYCDEEDQSEAINKPLPTGCGTIANAELPWSYGFEGIANYGEPQCWTLIPASYYSAYVTSSNYHEGSRAMYVTAGKADVNRSVVVLPEFDMPLKKFNVSFFYKGSNGTIAVGYVTNPADKSTFVQVGEAVTVGSSYQEATIPFTALGDVTGNIAFRFKGNTGDGSFYIDDIRVAETHVLSDAVDNSSVLADNVGQTVDVTIGRTFVCADYYNTICLPFDLSAEQLAASPIASNDLWAFKYARVEGGELLIRIIETDHINAGEPYLIAFPAGDPIVNPLFKNVTISASSGKTMGEENLKFVGTLKPETFAAHDDSKLFLYQNNTLYWWDGDAPSSLKSFRAFFTVEGGADSMPIKRLPARLIKHEETTTGVGAIQNGNVHCTKVLENNQVVIIRNGVKYSIQGQKVQ